MRVSYIPIYPRQVLMSGTGGDSKRKDLVRIHWPTIRKIIGMLYMQGAMRRTAIAMRCTIPYERVRMHLEWCESMKLTITRDVEGHGMITLTDRGHELYREQFSYIELEAG